MNIKEEVLKEFRIGEPIIFEYQHTNGNSYWTRHKQGIFLTKLNDEEGLVYLDGSKSGKKLLLKNIHRTSEAFDVNREFEFLLDKTRVNMNKFYTYKEAKQFIKFCQDEKEKQVEKLKEEIRNSNILDNLDTICWMIDQAFPDLMLNKSNKPLNQDLKVKEKK